MKRIKCIITDDEPFALKGLKNYVEQIDFLDLTGTATNAMELNSMMQNSIIDLLFLDIEMPLISGIDFLKSLQDPPMVIFTTAYEQYALKGYELNVLDYLLKPISFERFLKAANKAHQYFDRNNNEHLSDPYFFIKADNKLEKISIKDILHVESMQNYLRFHTTNGSLITHMTLKHAMTFLDPDKFIQTHKSHLIAVDKISSIDGNQIIIENHKVPIAKRMRETVLEKIVSSRLMNK